MRSSEIALRKELAVTRLRVARAELALARAQQQRPDALATASSAIDLASSILAQPGADRVGGRWTSYARVALQVLHVFLGVRRAV